MDNTIVILTILPPTSYHPPASKLSSGLSSGAVSLAGRSEQQDESLHALNLALPAPTKTALVEPELTALLSSLQTDGDERLKP